MEIENVFGLLWTQTWQVAVVGGVAWLICKSIAAQRPHLAHAIWLLVLLKAVTPPLWSSPSSPFSWATQQPSSVKSAVFNFSLGVNSRFDEGVSMALNEETETGIARISENDVVDSTPQAEERKLLAPLMEPRNLLIYVWLFGALASLGICMFRYVRFAYAINRSSRQFDPDIEQLTKKLAQKAGVYGRVNVIVLDDPVGPVVMGFVRPTIILPKSIVQELSTREVSFLLAHELTHISRGDLWWATLQIASKVVLWFHPMVHFANHNVSVESEHSCDCETVNLLGCKPMEYARCLLKVLNHKHSLNSVAVLPGVRPVEITSTRLERVMKLQHGSYCKLPLLTWAVIVIGAFLVLPGAGLTTAQELAKESEDHSAEKRKSYGKPLPLQDGPFGKFQRSQLAEMEKGKAGPKQALQLHTTIYALPETPSVRFTDFWSTFRNWDENETGLVQGLRDSTSNQSLVYNNPSRYRVFDSESDQKILETVNGVKFESKDVIEPITIITGESVPVQRSQKTKFLVGMIQVDGRPEEGRKVYRGFETGYDLSVQISQIEDDQYSIFCFFHFHDVENPTAAEQQQILEDPKFAPPKPSVVMKIVHSKIDFSINQKVAVLVRDVKQKPYVAIFECMTPPNLAADLKMVQASYETEVTKRPERKVTDGLLVFTSNGDDPTDLKDCRTINYFGYKMAVTRSVQIEKAKGWSTLRGTNVRWFRRGLEMMSADFCKFRISDDGQSLKISLNGNAKSWRDETTLHEADQIISTWSEEGASEELRGNARITQARPLYENEDYRYPDIKADHIWSEMADSDGVVCKGNVEVIEKSVSGSPNITLGEQIHVKLISGQTGASKKMEIKVIKAAKQP